MNFDDSLESLVLRQSLNSSISFITALSFDIFLFLCLTDSERVQEHLLKEHTL